MDKQIAIIIPTYKARATLGRTLASIEIQTIKDKIQVYVVDDCDGLDYSDIIDKYDLDITFLVRPENGGCGMARQYGMDNSTEPYYMFVDADDTLASSLAAEILLSHAKANDSDLVCGAFENDVRRDGKFFINITNESVTWMHGKLIKREFVDKHNIRFVEGLRTNEDVLWNQTFLAYNPKAHTVDKVCYSWLYNETSITRAKSPETRFNVLYDFVAMNDGFIQECIKRDLLDNEIAQAFIANGVVVNYIYLQELYDTYDEAHIEKYIERCREYYKNSLSKCEYFLTDALVTRAYGNAMKSTEFSFRVPTISLQDFVAKMRG